MAVRRDAVVASVVAEQTNPHSLRGALRAARRHIARTWLALVALFAIGIALLIASLSGYQKETKITSEMLLTAGTAPIIAVIAAPAVRGSFEPGGRRILLASSPSLSVATG
jgi:hypothetical protein